MKRFILIVMFLFVFTASAFAESVKLAWDPSSSADVAGYRFYLKEQVAGTKQKIGEVTVVGATHPTTATTNAFTIEGEKSHVIVATAYDKKGNESVDSNPAFDATTKETVVFVDTTPPSHPGSLGVQERIAKALEDLVKIARSGVPIRNVD